MKRATLAAVLLLLFVSLALAGTFRYSTRYEIFMADSSVLQALSIDIDEHTLDARLVDGSFFESALSGVLLVKASDGGLLWCEGSPLEPPFRSQTATGRLAIAGQALRSSAGFTFGGFGLAVLGGVAIWSGERSDSDALRAASGVLGLASVGCILVAATRIAKAGRELQRAEAEFGAPQNR